MKNTRKNIRARKEKEKVDGKNKEDFFVMSWKLLLHINPSVPFNF